MSLFEENYLIDCSLWYNINMQMSLSYFCSRVNLWHNIYSYLPRKLQKKHSAVVFGRESISLCNNSQIVMKIYSYFGIETQFGSLFNL